MRKTEMAMEPCMEHGITPCKSRKVGLQGGPGVYVTGASSAKAESESESQTNLNGVMTQHNPTPSGHPSPKRSTESPSDMTMNSHMDLTAACDISYSKLKLQLWRACTPTRSQCVGARATVIFHASE